MKLRPVVYFFSISSSSPSLSLSWAFQSVLFSFGRHTATTVSTCSSRQLTVLSAQTPQIDAEVVGAAGRIGSLFLSSSNGTRAVPRGVVPGSLSATGTPIFVTTPAKAWPLLYQDTRESRQDDLVWIGNGIPPPCGTVVVPHFGVLKANALPVTTSASPPTFVYGPHASRVQTILQEAGIDQVQRVETYSEIVMAAARKLLWAASMWLLCHDSDKPMTALQVHTQRTKDLHQLILQELLPALYARFPELKSAKEQEQQDESVMDYLYAYSRSMPQAIPNRDLALAEWLERNAFFLKMRDKVPQPLHEHLLEKVGGINEVQIMKSAVIIGNSSITKICNDSNTRTQVPIPELNLTLSGTPKTKPIQSAVIVGGGILGSSVALHLARQLLQDDAKHAKVTVVDLQAPHELGLTTKASWAWLNSNGKSPPTYAWLNQLGMDGWRRDPLLQDLPTWCGSLVRFPAPQTHFGGYRCEGPLGKHRIQELEPEANLQDDDDKGESSFVYFYPDEGLVDPSVAVHTIRSEAKLLGVRFIPQCNVTEFERDRDGTVTGTVGYNSVSGQDAPVTSISADVVVLAAGLGSNRLGKIPMLHRPGQLAFASPAASNDHSESDTNILQRILVDTTRESHVLQRKDGTLVVGGGALEVGGDGAKALTTAGFSHAGSDNSSVILQSAKQVVPGIIGKLLKKEEAVRPIPFDGLPAVGFLEKGLYSIVSHSGITLAPILGALVATELTHGLEIEALETFRPTRFLKGHDHVA